MYPCRLELYCVGLRPEVFDAVRAMPARDPFIHEFTVSERPDPAAASSADVILADLRDTDAPVVLQSLLDSKKSSAQLIVLAGPERPDLTADQLSKVTDLWVMPMTEEELRGRFSRWQEKAAAPRPTKDVFRGKRVLVVDDIAVNRLILTKLLTALGAECDTAENGQIAVDKFLASAPGELDIIMMDIQMPVMDGYTAARTIRASDHPLAKSIPVVAVSANALVEDVREALKSGMDAHIAKPVMVDKLLTSMCEVLEHRENHL